MDNQQQPIKHLSIVAVAGPKATIQPMKDVLLENFEKVALFPSPDNAGEYPDTSGYTAANWAEFESDNEDGALFPYMEKCMDAVLDYTDKRFERESNLSPGRVEKHIHWPKFGGDVFAVTGHVLVYPHRIVLVH